MWGPPAGKGPHGERRAPAPPRASGLRGAGQERGARRGLCRGPALAVPGGERAARGRRGRAGPWHGSPCRAGDRGGPGVEGRCFHQDASSLPRSLTHPARPPAPWSLPSVPPSGSSLPPALPPSRPPQPPPAGTCVSLVQFPLSLGCLSAGLRRLAPPPRAPPPPPPSAWPSPAATQVPPALHPAPRSRFIGAPPSHLVFASRPPTCHWRRDVWESPAPRPPGPACPGAEVSHGRGAAGAGGQGGKREGRREGDGGPGGSGDRPGATLNFHFSFRRRRGPGATGPARLLRGGGGLGGGEGGEGGRQLGTLAWAPGAGRRPQRLTPARRPSPLGLRYVDGAGSSSLRGPRKVCLRAGSGTLGPRRVGVGDPGNGGRAAAC